MNRIVAVVLAVALAGLGACSTPRYSADLLRTPIDAPYQLASGDRLRVIVFGQDNLSNSFSVDGAGNVAMPLIGLVHAQGLTTAQFGKVVEGKLRQGFLRDPSVSVEVEAYRPFFVLGEVTVAGQYPFVNGMTVQNAIAVAGGFTPRGDIIFESIVDEEFAGGNGTLAARLSGFNADLAVLTEPTRMQVCPACLGAFLGDITIRGKAGMPYMGSAIANPVFAAARVISLFKKWQDQWRKENSHPLFEEPGKELNVVLSSISSTVPGEFTQMGIPLVASVSWIVWCYPGMTEAEQAFPPEVTRFETLTGHKSKRNLQMCEKLGYHMFKTEPFLPTIEWVYLQKERK